MNSLLIPASIIDWGEFAFAYCENLTTVEILSPIQSIPKASFLNCSALKSINIPSSVEIIYPAAFFQCSSLPIINIPNSVKIIGDKDGDNGEVFEGCTSLTKIEIPNSVTKIGMYTFGGCENLTTAYIPNSVTFIGFGALQNCQALIDVSIPSDVESLIHTFWFCPSIKKVSYSATCPIEAERYIFDEEIYHNATLYMREDAIDKAKNIQPWSLFDKIEAYDFCKISEILSEIDVNDSIQIFTLGGNKIDGILDSLSKGIYLVRQGSKSWKVAID